MAAYPSLGPLSSRGIVSLPHGAFRAPLDPRTLPAALYVRRITRELVLVAAALADGRWVFRRPPVEIRQKAPSAGDGAAPVVDMQAPVERAASRRAA